VDITPEPSRAKIDVAVELRLLPATLRVPFVALAVERLVRSYRWAAAPASDLPELALDAVWGGGPGDPSALFEQIQA
jgi:hypothetical protein